jgi:hypothetical protein
LNQYQYAAGNPLAFIDPTGLCAQSNNKSPVVFDIFGALMPAHSAAIRDEGAYIGGSLGTHLQYASEINATKLGLSNIAGGMTLAAAGTAGITYAAPAIGAGAVWLGNAANSASFAAYTTGSAALTAASQWGASTLATTWTMANSAAVTTWATANSAANTVYTVSARVAVTTVNTALTHPVASVNAMQFANGYLAPTVPSTGWESTGTALKFFQDWLNGK